MAVNEIQGFGRFGRHFHIFLSLNTGESLLSFRYENHVVVSIITDVNNQVQQNLDMAGLAKS